MHLNYLPFYFVAGFGSFILKPFFAPIEFIREKGVIPLRLFFKAGLFRSATSVSLAITDRKVFFCHSILG